ncbi:ArsR/SmtB family transcription factor, partial [Klebsiella pneumoniae]
MINQVDFFKCLSDQTRLNILKLVLNKQNICVCELTEQLELSQPKISRHLALLRTHG